VAARKDWEESERRRLAEEEAASVRPPQLSSASHMMFKGGRNVSDMLKWNEARKAKLNEMRAQKNRKEVEELKDRPPLHSDARVAKSMTSTRVHERLHKYDAEQRKRKERARSAENAAARATARPVLTEAAALLNRPGNVGDRLYAAAMEKPSPSQLHRHKEQSRPAASSFKPKINERSKQIARAHGITDVPIETLLSHKAAQVEEKRQLRLSEEREQVRQKIEAPKMSNTSRRLAEQYALETGENARDRLEKPTRFVKERTLLDIQLPTFAPEIPLASRAMTRTGLGGGGRPTPAVTGCASKPGSAGGRQTPGRMSEETENNPIAMGGAVEYDPNMSLHTVLAGGGGGGAVAAADYSQDASSLGGGSWAGVATDVYAKNQGWASSRAERLERERRAHKKKEMEECTFAPKLSNNTAYDKAHLATQPSSSGGSGGGGTGHDGAGTVGRYESYLASDPTPGGPSRASTEHGATRVVVSGAEIAARNADWVKARERKLEEKRAANQTQEDALCTFAPSVVTGRDRKWVAVRTHEITTTAAALGRKSLFSDVSGITMATSQNRPTIGFPEYSSIPGESNGFGNGNNSSHNGRNGHNGHNAYNWTSVSPPTTTEDSYTYLDGAMWTQVDDELSPSRSPSRSPNPNESHFDSHSSHSSHVASSARNAVGNSAQPLQWLSKW
jgi:hypothetical protein